MLNYATSAGGKVASRTFRIYCDTDYPTSVYRDAGAAASLADCLDACALAEGCLAAVFDAAPDARVKCALKMVGDNLPAAGSPAKGVQSGVLWQ